MAWPIDAVYEVLVAGSTTAKAALGTAIQNAVIGVVGGSKSLKSLLVDGTGNVANAGTTGAAGLSGASADTAACGESVRVPTTRKLWWNWKPNANYRIRLYYSTDGIDIVFNASFTTPNWTADHAATSSNMLRINSTGWTWYYKAAAAAAWADGAWASSSQLVAATQAATFANVNAQGTPVGSAGPGIVKGNRIYAEGAALNAAGSDFTLTGWGGAGLGAAVTGDDTHGVIVITAGAAPAANPTAQLAFGGGSYTGAPTCIVVMNDASTAAEAVHCRYTYTNNGWTVTFPGTPTNGRTYTFTWWTIGRQ